MGIPSSLSGTVNAMIHDVAFDGQLKNLQETAAKIEIQQDARSAEETLAPKEMNTSGYIDKTQKKLPKPVDKSTTTSKTSKTEKAEEKKNTEEDVGQKANEFVQSHKEFDQEGLENLREQIKPDDDAEAILSRVKARFPKPSQADDALEFLLLTSQGDLRNKIQEAKTQHYDTNSREINAGRQLTKIARETADQAFGLGKTQKLDTIFTDMVAEGADSTALHKQLSAQYEYKDMKKLLDYVSKSAGRELGFEVHDTKQGLKLEVKSLEQAYLIALCKEIRIIQGIMGVYRSSEKGMPGMASKAEKDEQRWREWAAHE